MRESQEVELPAGSSSGKVLLLGAAWANDPTGRFWWRYWDGDAWSAWASNGDEMVWDPVASGPDVAEQRQLDYLRAYLVGAAARGVISADAAAALDADAASWQQVPVLGPPSTIDLRPPPPTVEQVPRVEAVPTGPDSWVPPSTVAPARPAPAPGPEPVTGTSPPRPKLRDRAVAAVRRSWHAATAELALHGLADLGALLVFAGLFGFVAFAFGEVQPGLRPVAEVLIPATAFAVGTFLRRRGTRVVGDVMVVLGGSLLPVVLIASFSDDAVPPPDLTGTSLVVALVGSLVGVALVEAYLVHRSPDSPLRFVVAPTAWLAVAAAGLGLGRPVPTGSDLATPGPLQWALVVVAVTTTVVVSQRLVGGRWSRTVAAAAWPALLVAFSLTLLAAQREGWPPWPVLVAGIGTLVTLELLAGRSSRVVVAVADLTVLVVTASVLLQTWEAGRVAAGLAVVLVGLSEVAHRRQAPPPVVVGGLVGAALALGAAAGEASVAPVDLAVASGIGWAWAAAQTRWPTTLDRNWSSLLVWVLPVPFVAGVFEASSAPVATLVVAVVVALVALAMRALEEERRTPWTLWVPGVGSAVSLAVLAQVGASTWATVTAAALVAVACGAAPLRTELRAAASALAAVSGVAAAADLLGWSAPDVAPLVAVVAGGVVLAASALLRRRSLDGFAWAGVVALGSLVQVGAAAAWADSVDRYPSGLWVVAGVAANAVGLGLAATPSGWPWPRHASALVGSGAVLLLVPTFDLGPVTVVVVASAAVVVAAAVRLTLRSGTSPAVWRQPLTVVTVVGALAASVAAVDAGPGWSALALAAAAAAAALHVVGATGFWRTVAQAVTVASAAGAWGYLGDWQGWSAETWVASGAVLGAALLVVAVATAWLPGLARDWSVVAGGAGLLALVASTVGLYGESVDRGAAGPWVAGALAVASLCAALLVRPTGWAGWRTVAALFAVGSAAVLLDAVGAGAVEILAASVTAGLLGTAGLVVVSVARRGRGWTPALEGVALAGLAGAALAGAEVGRRGVALFLLLLGVELLAFGTVRRQRGLLYSAPAALCASWLVFASDVFDRGPTWFTVPAGATVLVTVELARGQRRAAGLPPSNRPLVLAELFGTVLLVVTPLVQIVQLGLVHVVESVLLGAALVVWGVLTRVRRRLVAGVATTAAALLLLLVVPMVDVARRASGPLVWLLVAGAGLVAIMVAAAFERHGDGTRSRQHRVRAAVEGWE